jgi:ABC-2 type transport system permease protein
MIKKLYSKQNRALLSELVRTLFMFAILYVVFAIILNVGEDIDNFPIYLLFGIVLWNFFAEMTQQSLLSIVLRGDLIRKIKIPRWLIIVSNSIGALINLLLNMVVVMIFVFITGMDINSSALLLPFFLIEIYLIALGLSLGLSALYVKYRDVSYIWDVVLQAGFYATPILYPLTLITNETMQKVLMLNPMAQAIQGARNVFVTQDALTIGEVWGSRYVVLVPVAITAAMLIAGVVYFKKESKYFAENL